METKPKKNSYSKEFKIQAVERCKVVGIKKASEELGVCTASLSNWKKLFDPSSDKSKSKDKPTYEELQKEVIRLRKELGYVEEINDILKKVRQSFRTTSFEVRSDFFR
ncbi:MAG: transposase [Bacteriovoracaceae bacterium]